MINLFLMYNINKQIAYFVNQHCDYFYDLMFVDPCIIVKFIQKYPTRCNSVSKFIIPCLYEAQHVSDDTPPIIRSLKLH